MVTVFPAGTVSAAASKAVAVMSPEPVSSPSSSLMFPPAFNRVCRCAHSVTSTASPPVVSSTKQSPSSLANFAIAPLPDRPEVNTPGVAIDTPTEPV